MVSVFDPTILWVGASRAVAVEYKIRDGRLDDFARMRGAIVAAITPALVTPDIVLGDAAASGPIVESVEAAFRHGVIGRAQQVLVGERQGEPCGFAVLDLTQQAVEMRWIVVLADHRGRGLAPALMAAILTRHGASRVLRLVVTRYNTRAIRFFERFGFVEEGGGASAARVIRMRRETSTPEGGEVRGLSV